MPAYEVMNEEGPISMMSPESITLQVGENTLEMSEAGITLSVGENVVEITPAGVTINGVMVEITGEATTTISSAAVMISEG